MQPIGLSTLILQRNRHPHTRRGKPSKKRPQNVRYNEVLRIYQCKTQRPCGWARVPRGGGIVLRKEPALSPYWNLSTNRFCGTLHRVDALTSDFDPTLLPPPSFCDTVLCSILKHCPLTTCNPRSINILEIIQRTAVACNVPDASIKTSLCTHSTHNRLTPWQALCRNKGRP